MIEMLTASGKAPSPAADKTKILLLGDSGYVDLANPTRTIQQVGNPGFNTGTPYWGTRSFDFNVGNYSKAVVTDSSLILPADGEWTVELFCRMRVRNVNTVPFVAGSFGVTVNDSTWRITGHGANATVSSSSLAWSHIAIVASGGVVKTYFNGILRATGTTVAGALGNITLGSGDYASGWIDGFRVSNIARYTGDFTPPTVPFVVD